MRIKRLQLTARRWVAVQRGVAVGRPSGSLFERGLPGGRPPGDTRVEHGGRQLSRDPLGGQETLHQGEPMKARDLATWLMVVPCAAALLVGGGCSREERDTVGQQQVGQDSATRVALPEGLVEVLQEYARGGGPSVLLGRELAKKYLSEHPRDPWALYLRVYGDARLGFFELKEMSETRGRLAEAMHLGLPRPQAELAEQLMLAIPVDATSLLTNPGRLGVALDRIESDLQTLAASHNPASSAKLSYSNLGQCLAAAPWTSSSLIADERIIQSEHCVKEIVQAFNRGWTGAYHPKVLVAVILAGEEKFPPETAHVRGRTVFPLPRYFLHNLVSVLEELGPNSSETVTVFGDLVHVLECGVLPSSTTLRPHCLSGERRNLEELTNAALAIEMASERGALKPMVAAKAYEVLSPVASALRGERSTETGDLLIIVERTLKNLAR